MSRYSKNRILPVILAIVVIIIVIAGLVGLARLLFTGGNSKPADNKPVAVDVSREALLSTGPGSSVTMNVRGPIVAQENFRSYQITVAPASRQVKTFTGYLDAVIDQENLPNNTAAYTQFVYALDKANLSLGTQSEGGEADLRGICATGRVTQFIINKDDKPVKTLWTSTCSGSPGSLKASVSQLNNLFVTQIPNANSFIRKVSL